MYFKFYSYKDATASLLNLMHIDHVSVTVAQNSGVVLFQSITGFCLCRTKG